MAPLVIELLFYVLAAICLFVEMVTVGSARRVSLVALALLFFVIGHMIPALNAIVTR